MLNLTEVLCPEFPFSTGWTEQPAPGSHVMVGVNRGPIYEVVSVVGGHAWVRPLSNGQEGLVELGRLRPAASPAA
jgi:hypothetical protein